MYIYTHIHIHTYTYIMRMHIYIYIYMHVYIYTHREIEHVQSCVYQYLCYRRWSNHTFIGADACESIVD